MRQTGLATGVVAMRPRLTQRTFKQKRSPRRRRAPAEPGIARIPV